MNQSQIQLKPWSQTEDDAAETFASAEPALSAPTSVMPAPVGKTVRTFSGTSWPGLDRIRSIHALVPTAAALVWVVGAAVLPTNQPGLPPIQALGVACLLACAAAIVVTAWRTRRRAMAALELSIASTSRRAAGKWGAAALGAEIQPLWEAVERQTAEVTRQIEQLLEERKELGLELSLIAVQKRQAEAIIRSMSDPVLVTDSYDQLVLANPAAEELFGFKCPDALRQPLTVLVADEKLVALIRQAREADTRVARRRTEHEIGEQVFALTMSPVASGQSEDEVGVEHHGVVVLLRDITKERKAARLKSEFVAQVAHELRTPLSSIRAYVEMLVDGEAADEKTRSEYFEIIQTSADGLGRLIDNMLNISRIEAGTVRINKEPIAVSMVAKEAADMMRPAAEQKGISLSEELTPVMYRVLADRDLLYQAVLNLLSNAVKYTPEGGRIHLRVIPQEESKTIRVEVSDSGVGIPKEDLPRMFQKFFRVEKNKEMAKGTGLGLNLVKQIVETVHGGELTLSSEVGKGSTFGMILPLTQ
ncbi:MAG: hypothetical protein DCC65_09685 [Planctomycetota bacterium]|nr:MAG: hypothetical protein DCC65_09685 [Planctomycetota bacterium]